MIQPAQQALPPTPPTPSTFSTKSQPKESRPISSLPSQSPLSPLQSLPSELLQHIAEFQLDGSLSSVQSTLNLFATSMEMRSVGQEIAIHKLAIRSLPDLETLTSKQLIRFWLTSVQPQSSLASPNTNRSSTEEKSEREKVTAGKEKEKEVEVEKEGKKASPTKIERAENEKIESLIIKRLDEDKAHPIEIFQLHSRLESHPRQHRSIHQAVQNAGKRLSFIPLYANMMVIKARRSNIIINPKALPKSTLNAFQHDSKKPT